MDKDGIVQLEGVPKFAAVADQAIIPGSTGFIPGYDPYPDNDGSGDPAKAKALLSQAGYPHGVTVKLLYSTLEPNPLVAQALQASLGEAGFNVKLVPVTLSAFFGSYLRSRASPGAMSGTSPRPGGSQSGSATTAAPTLSPFTDPGWVPTISGVTRARSRVHLSQRRWRRRASALLPVGGRRPSARS